MGPVRLRFTSGGLQFRVDSYGCSGLRITLGLRVRIRVLGSESQSGLGLELGY